MRAQPGRHRPQTCSLVPVAAVVRRRIFFDKRMAQEVDADPLGDEFKGYVLRCARVRPRLRATELQE